MPTLTRLAAATNAVSSLKLRSGSHSVTCRPTAVPPARVHVDQSIAWPAGKLARVQAAAPDIPGAVAGTRPWRRCRHKSSDHCSSSWHRVIGSPPLIKWECKPSASTLIPGGVFGGELAALYGYAGFRHLLSKTWCFLTAMVGTTSEGTVSKVPRRCAGKWNELTITASGASYMAGI
jgi:hypothetical protein